MFKVALLLVSICALSVLAQTPHKPTWPDRFSATVMVEEWREFPQRFNSFRWFYDRSQNKDRLDGLVSFESELYFAEIIFDHSAEKRYDIFFQGETEQCFTRAINGTLPRPTFENVHFVGKALVDYEPCFHWIETSRDGRFSFNYYEVQESRTPKRIDFADNRRGHASTWTFFEFDQCNQDKDLFNIPDIIKNQCTPY